MARLNANTRVLSEKIFIATISAHYHHGLGPGLKLNLQQVAGESVEAALTFSKVLQDENDHGTVTAVMDANNAFAQGFVLGMTGDSLDVVIAARPELQESYERGWAAGDAKAAENRKQAN